MSETLLSRVAAAPISWGVCEVPGWGHQLSAAQVLGDMRTLGLTATELGPAGFLPDEPMQRERLLSTHGLRQAGGFVPLVLHRDFEVSQELERLLHEFARVGAVLVIAAVTGNDGYDARPTLKAREWNDLLEALDDIRRLALDYGARAVLHPHVGTVVETTAEVERVLAGSDIDLCLDTGHLLIGGTDPLALAQRATRRVGHVHLKDVRAELADRVRAAGLTYTSAVREGIYPVLGKGDVDIPGVIAALESGGYEGWYVLEQDIVLDAEPEPEMGPARDVAAAMHYLLTLEG